MPQINTEPVNPYYKEFVPREGFANQKETLPINTIHFLTALYDKKLQETIKSDSNLSYMKDAFFMLDKDNNLQPVKDSPGTMSSKDIRAFTKAACEGRLFVRDPGENALRQLNAAAGKDRDDVAISLSSPVSDLSFVKAPERPSFWKYLLYPFFSDEIKSYNQKMAEHKKLNSDEINDAFDIACGKEPRSSAKAKAEEKTEVKAEAKEEAKTEVKEAAKTEVKTEEKKDAPAKKESLKEFENRLKEYSKLQPATVGLFIKPSPADRTEDKILDTMCLHARRAAALEILKNIDKNPGQKKEILQKAQKAFDPMIEDIREFLPKTVDKQELELVSQKGIHAPNGMELSQKMDFIGETALQNYQNYLKDGDNFKQRMFVPFSKGIEMDKAGQDKDNVFCEPLGLKKPEPKAEPEKQGPAGPQIV